MPGTFRYRFVLFFCLLYTFTLSNSSAHAERLELLQGTTRDLAAVQGSKEIKARGEVAINAAAIRQLFGSQIIADDDEVALSFRRYAANNASSKSRDISFSSTDARGAIFRFGTDATQTELFAAVKFGSRVLIRSIEIETKSGTPTVESYRISFDMPQSDVDTVNARIVLLEEKPISKHDAIKVDASSIKPEESIRGTPGSAGGGMSSLLAGGILTSPTVDVLVAYTTMTKNHFGSQVETEMEIMLAIEVANLALSRSNVAHRFRLVHTMEVADAGLEINDMHAALNRLTSADDGIADEVHVARNQYGADIVSAITITSDPGASGVGWLWDDLDGLLSTIIGSMRAFSISQISRGLFILAHEMGHNLGLMHEPQHSDYPGMFSYSYGRSGMLDFCGGHSSGCPANFGTIMAYQGNKVWNFSNPQVSIAGYPSGSQSTHNNAATLNESMPAASKWRSAQVPTQPSTIGPWMQSASTGLAGHIEIEWQADPLATGYLLYRSTSGYSYCAEEDLVIEHAITEPRFEDNTSGPTDYYYTVRALHGFDRSECSPNIVHGTSVALEEFLAASQGMYDDRVSVTWNVNEGYWTRLKIYRTPSGTNCTCIGVPKATLLSGVSHWDDVTVSPSQFYNYCAKAEHPVTSWISTYLWSPCSYQRAGYAASLLAPTNFSASDGLFNNRVRLSWTPSHGAADGYRIYRSMFNSGQACEAGTGVTTFEIAGASTSSYDDSTVQLVGVPYYYSMRAKSGTALSPNCTSIDSGHIAGLVPPASVTASNGAYENKVGIVWWNVPAVSGYRLYRNSDCSGTPLATFGVGQLIHWDYDVTYPNHYWYSVRSFNQSGTSACSLADEGWLAAPPLQFSINSRAASRQ